MLACFHSSFFHGDALKESEDATRKMKFLPAGRTSTFFQEPERTCRKMRKVSIWTNPLKRIQQLPRGPLPRGRRASLRRRAPRPESRQLDCSRPERGKRSRARHRGTVPRRGGRALTASLKPDEASARTEHTASRFRNRRSRGVSRPSRATSPPHLTSDESTACC